KSSSRYSCKKIRKSKETKDAEDQDQEVPFETDQGDTFVTSEKSKGSGEAQEEQISPSTLELPDLYNLHLSASLSSGEINAAEVNTGEAERVQRRKGKEPMNEEDLQVMFMLSKYIKMSTSSYWKNDAVKEERTRRMNRIMGSSRAKKEQKKRKLVTQGGSDSADFWVTQQSWIAYQLELTPQFLRGIHTNYGKYWTCVSYACRKANLPLTKEVLSQMLELKLETEEESSMALELIKFVRHQLEEFEDSNDDDHGEEERSKSKRPACMTSPEQTATGKGISNPLMAVKCLPKSYGVKSPMYSRLRVERLLVTMDMHLSGGQRTGLLPELMANWYREYDLAHLKLVFEFSIHPMGWIQRTDTPYLLDGYD
ncbi:hypothetical protein Tco_1116321, partial [Tanacetum coccineum]